MSTPRKGDLLGDSINTPTTPTHLKRAAVSPVDESCRMSLSKESIAAFRALLQEENEKQNTKLIKDFNTSLESLELRVNTRLDKQDTVNTQVTSELNTLRAEVRDLKGQVEDLSNRSRKQVEDLSNRSRRQNLIFTGFPIQEGGREDSIRMVSDFCREKLGIENIVPNRAHRLQSGPPGKLDMMANFTFDSDVRLILKNSIKLKGQPYYVNKNYVGHLKKVDMALRRFRKELFLKGVKSNLGTGCLYVVGCRMDVNLEMGLMMGKMEGCAALSERLSFDVNPLWAAAWKKFPRNGSYRGDFRDGGGGLQDDNMI